MKRLAFLIAAALFALSGTTVCAQSTAQNTAAVLQTWRTNCKDPNPDLAIGYLRDSTKTKDPIIERICLRQVLESDNGDVRSAALRTVIGSGSLVRFEVAKPEGKLEGRDNGLWKYIQTGLAFRVTEGDPTNGSATWQSIVQNTAPNPSYQGRVDVLGTGIRWGGVVLAFGQLHKCRLSAELGQGDVLQGTFQCSDGALFPVTTHLLD